MIRKHQLVLKEKGRTDMPQVLIASSECSPLSKTGGLADVAGALPKSFAKLGIDARVITPYHKCIKHSVILWRNPRSFCTVWQKNILPGHSWRFPDLPAWVWQTA